MKPQHLFSVVLGMASLAFPALAANFTYSDLTGTWKVASVAVPDEGGQALVDNDPQYMGAVIQFGPNDITWTKGTETRPIDPSIDNCDIAPSLTPWKADPNSSDQQPIKDGFSVMCGDEAWGTLAPVDDKTVKLHYLDNGVLTLTRQKAIFESVYFNFSPTSLAGRSRTTSRCMRHTDAIARSVQTAADVKTRRRHEIRGYSGRKPMTSICLSMSLG